MSRTWLVKVVGLAAVVVGGLALCAGPAAAGPRHKRVRRNHPFATDPAPVSPAERPAVETSDDGAVPGGSDPGGAVPGGAVPGGASAGERAGSAIGGDGLATAAPDLSYSPWPYYGPAPLLELEPGRALLLTYQQGLLVLDTSDADAPRVSARVAIEGFPAQLLVDGDRAIVLSSRWEESGSSTLVTSLDVSGTPELLGTATVVGWPVNAALADGALQLLTSEQDVTALLDVSGAAILPANPVAVVTRLALGRGAPRSLGSVRLPGYVVASRLTSGEAAVVTQRTEAVGDGDGDGDVRPANGLWPWRNVSELVVVRAAGADTPVVAGRTELLANQWVRSVERTADAFLLVTVGARGSLLETFDADAAPLGSLQLAGDAAAGLVLADDVLAYMSVSYATTTTPTTTGPVPGGPDRFAGPAAEPTIALHTVDVGDPAAPRAAAAVRLGPGWGGPLVLARGGVLGTVAGTGTDFAFHAALLDPDAPLVTRTDLEPGVFLRTAFDEIAVFGVSRWTASEGATQGLQIADVSAGLARLSPVVEAGFPQQIDRSENLIGLGGTLRFSLLDVRDPLAPRLRGSAVLAVNVIDVEPLGDGAAVVLASDWETGGLELRSVSLPGGDALAPLDVLELGSGHGQLFADPPYVYVVATGWDGETRVQVVDATDPSALRARGSLDLASYPGEVFLHDGALLLLRRVWDLVVDPLAEDVQTTADTGVRGKVRGKARGRRGARRRMVRKKDDFGRVRWPWLRDALGAVLDSVDLSDPDAPRAANRTRLRWDPAGPARLAGDVLYVPSYRVVAGPAVVERAFVEPALVEHGRCVYGVGMIGIANPLRPRVGTPRPVPGMLADATTQTGIVLTTAYRYDPATWESSVTLNLVDLTAPLGERVLARADLGSGFAQVRAGDGHAYAVSSIYEVYPAAEGVQTTASAPSRPASTLTTFDLADLTQTDRQQRDRDAFGLELEGGHLFLRSGTWTGRLDAYTLTAPSAPSFVRTLDVTGYAPRIRVADGLALIPAGLSGLQVFDLARD